jgi:DNA polymerase
MGAEQFMPDGRASLTKLREAASGCQGCELYRRATQTVFGEGSTRASLMLVGEQPGDAEDRDGSPFVGPSGRLLDRALGELGLDRKDVYITNVVKHFKWESKGSHRLHKNPSAREVAACRPWLQAEIETVRPAVVMCLGATAARALLGPSFRVTSQRGQFFSGPSGSTIGATVHPSSIIRLRGHDEREADFRQFVADLRGAQTYTPRV